MAKSINLVGQRFTRLNVIKDTGKRRSGGAIIWLCKCDCGNYVEVDTGCLKKENTKSCGCLAEETRANFKGNTIMIDKTSINSINRKKVSKNNRTGHIGITLENGLYRAKIGFAGKSYHLGRYKNIEDAIMVRRKAEDVLHKCTVEHYIKWKEKASKEPDWAKENPIKIEVIRRNKVDFEVKLLPEL